MIFLTVYQMTNFGLDQIEGICRSMTNVNPLHTIKTFNASGKESF